MPNPPTRPRKNAPGLSELESTAIDIENRVCNLETDRDKMEKALWGNNGRPGMVGRLDKVEEIIADIKKLLWAILGVVLGIAIGGIWQAIAHAVAGK